MDGVKTYDPNNVQIIMGGFPITGYADGSFIEVAYDEDLYSKTVGADGEVSRAKMNNRSATVTITLKQTSATNDELSALYAADQANNAGVVPLFIKEQGTGRTLVFAQAAWVQKLPNLNYSKDVEDRVWTVATAQLKSFIGGNTADGQVD
jgi:hypothetical protein